MDVCKSYEILSIPLVCSWSNPHDGNRQFVVANTSSTLITDVVTCEQ
ncbi:hypothetical protein FIV07_09265 [Mycobacterium sp. THAF192]|nr:hypothetical protein FIV07_09265 [Mycobacterium sp. THAF192]